jgi:hypothetical protein
LFFSFYDFLMVLLSIVAVVGVVGVSIVVCKESIVMIDGVVESTVVGGLVNCCLWFLYRC